MYDTGDSAGAGGTVPVFLEQDGGAEGGGIRGSGSAAAHRADRGSGE